MHATSVTACAYGTIRQCGGCYRRCSRNAVVVVRIHDQFVGPRSLQLLRERQRLRGRRAPVAAAVHDQEGHVDLFRPVRSGSSCPSSAIARTCTSPDTITTCSTSSPRGGCTSSSPAAGKLRPIAPGPRSLFARSANGFAVIDADPLTLTVKFVETDLSSPYSFTRSRNSSAQP
jgi:ferredoxin